LNRRYVLNNSFDHSMYHKSRTTDTRSISEAKVFPSRSLASRYLEKNNLTESYEVRLLRRSKVVNESVSNEDAKREIRSSVDDLIDVIEVTADLVEMYRDSVDDDMIRVDIDKLLDKIKKIQKYSTSIDFYPSFRSSTGSTDEPGESDG